MLSRSLRILFGVILAATLFSHDSIAQQFFTVNMTAPAMVNVGGTIPYSISVQNVTQGTLQNVNVSSSFPTSLQVASVSPVDGARGPVTTNPGMVTWVINTFGAGETIQFNLTLQTTQAGTVVNNVSVTGAGAMPGSASATTTVSEVTGQSDLSVTISTNAGTVFINDWVAFTVRVANGGATASGVVLTTTLSSGAEIIDWAPSSGVTASGQQLSFNIGTLEGQSSTNLRVTVALNTPNNTITAQVRAGGMADTNAVNDMTTAMLTAIQPVLGQLEATRASDQFYNRQNTLIEQLITVRNVGTTSVPSARVVLDFPHRVVNAVGTNDGNPFVVHGGPIGTNETVELLLEYAIPNRETTDDPGLEAYPAGNIDLTPPSAGTNAPITAIRMVNLRATEIANTNRVLVEFPAERGAAYVIVYSTNMVSERKAQPPIVAQANRVQWLDYGPPKTLTRPGPTFTTNQVVTTNMMGMPETNPVVITHPSMRFYRAIRLP
jgi:uncharacterized repeat protein (TIGR01451 family)